MTVHDAIIAKLRHLPEPLANQVNDFIDSLMGYAQAGQAAAALNETPAVYRVGTALVVESTPIGDLAATIDQVREERMQQLMTHDERSV